MDYSRSSYSTNRRYGKLFFLKCYNISNVGDIEYSYIKSAYKLFDRIFEYSKDRNKKSIKEKDNASIREVASNTISPTMSCIISHIDEIFQALGEEKFIDGQ